MRHSATYKHRFLLRDRPEPLHDVVARHLVGTEIERQLRGQIEHLAIAAAATRTIGFVEFLAFDLLVLLGLLARQRRALAHVAHAVHFGLESSRDFRIVVVIDAAVARLGRFDFRRCCRCC